MGSCRPINPKAGSNTLTRFYLNPAPVHRHDPPALREPEAEPAAGLPSGIERVEQMLAIGLAQARTIVGHLEQRELPIALLDHPGRDPDRTAAGQRLQAVLDQ